MSKEKISVLGCIRQTIAEEGVKIITAILIFLIASSFIQRFVLPSRRSCTLLNYVGNIIMIYS
jgi:hypothetical protein